MFIYKFFAVLLPLLLTFPNTSVAKERSTEEPKSPCRLQVGNAHLSTSLFEKSQLRAVKVNATSICNVPQSKVTITVELWKTGLLGNHLVAKQTTRSTGTTFPGSRVKNFNTFRKCFNLTPTNYFGVAYSKALIDGEWQFARRVLSKEITSLKCGT